MSKVPRFAYLASKHYDLADFFRGVVVVVSPAVTEARWPESAWRWRGGGESFGPLSLRWWFWSCFFFRGGFVVFCLFVCLRVAVVLSSFMVDFFFLVFGCTCLIFLY